MRTKALYCAGIIGSIILVGPVDNKMLEMGGLVLGIYTVSRLSRKVKGSFSG